MPNYDVAAFVWPSYHHEPRLAHYWQENDGEWYTVRRGTPRFPGHDMPKHPLLGYQDEADPTVMRQQVDLALHHGVNVFIMDWYWYDDAPCFERQLNEGLMPAVEGTDMRFYLMWANHDANSLWDPHTDRQDPLFSARVDRAGFERVMERHLERYFQHPNYYRIDGKPVLSIYLVSWLIADLGGIQGTRDAFAWLQDRAREQGLPGIHLQAIYCQSTPHEMGERIPDTRGLTIEDMIAQTGFDSATSYQMVHVAGGTGDFVQWAAKAITRYEACDKTVPDFFPHVSIGWDNTQRHPNQNAIVTGSTPWAFEACLHWAKDFLDARPERVPLVTINSWNEWTEGSYLLPDLRWGYAYLEAIRTVFGPV